MSNKLIQCTSAVVFISALYGILALKMLLSDQHKYRWAYIVQEKKKFFIDLFPSRDHSEAIP